MCVYVCVCVFVYVCVCLSVCVSKCLAGLNYDLRRFLNCIETCCHLEDDPLTGAAVVVVAVAAVAAVAACLGRGQFHTFSKKCTKHHLLRQT